MVDAKQSCKHHPYGICLRCRMDAAVPPETLRPGELTAEEELKLNMIGSFAAKEGESARIGLPCGESIWVEVKSPGRLMIQTTYADFRTIVDVRSTKKLAQIFAALADETKVEDGLPTPEPPTSLTSKIASGVALAAFFALLFVLDPFDGGRPIVAAFWVVAMISGVIAVVASQIGRTK
jgi:hypothetical protein